MRKIAYTLTATTICAKDLATLDTDVTRSPETVTDSIGIESLVEPQEADTSPLNLAKRDSDTLMF